MKQAARSEKSRSQILAAALRLFSSQGYRGTNMREIAEAAGVSTGNVYHQFDDKQAIFQTLLDEYATMVNSPSYPFNKAISDGLVRAHEKGEGLPGYLGIRLTETWPGGMRAEVAVRDDLLNPFGNLHGGVLAALCDHVLSCAAPASTCWLTKSRGSTETVL